MSTLEAIQSKIKRLQAQAEALATKQTTDTLDRIRGLMNKHGLTVADIDGHLTGQKRRVKAADKHAGNGKAKPTTANGELPAQHFDPKTGKSWSGRGRPPAWFKDLNTISPKGRRAGPQPAKYRDPKSGATWSGRGPAPAWLAGAKDRTKFLIDSTIAVEAQQSPATKAKVAVKKKVTAKSAVVRKTAVAKRVAAPTMKKRAGAKVPGRTPAAVKKTTGDTQKSQATGTANA